MDDKPESRRVKSIVLTALFFIFLWLIDISVTSIINGLTLTNGFWNITPDKTYHIAIYGLTTIFLITILKGDNNNRKKR